MIREATDADRQPVRALQEATLDSPAPALLELGFDTDAATVLVAEDEAVVGYALAMPGDPAESPSVVYLAELVVAPGVRREGYGAALLDALAARFDDYDELRLTARAGDEGVRSFYRAQGFWNLSDLRDHFDGEDGVLLVRDL